MKAYDTLRRDRLFTLMPYYGFGPNIRALVTTMNQDRVFVRYHGVRDQRPHIALRKERGCSISVQEQVTFGGATAFDSAPQPLHPSFQPRTTLIKGAIGQILDKNCGQR